MIRFIISILLLSGLSCDTLGQCLKYSDNLLVRELSKEEFYENMPNFVTGLNSIVDQDSVKFQALFLKSELNQRHYQFSESDTLIGFECVVVPFENNQGRLSYLLNVGHEGFCYFFLMDDKGNLDETEMDGTGCLNEEGILFACPFSGDEVVNCKFYDISDGIVREIAELNENSGLFYYFYAPISDIKNNSNNGEQKEFLPALLCDGKNFYLTISKKDWLTDDNQIRYYKITIRQSSRQHD